MRVSVIINTNGRGQSLAATLSALERQEHDDFEVIVVQGPVEDQTQSLISSYEGGVRHERCPDLNLSRSRNIGINAAAGEILAFIDDDAVPEPAWITDLLRPYVEAQVGGTGGIVMDHTGSRPQYQYSLCSRIGRTRFDLSPPFNAETARGADPFVYLQGTNMSFRREALAEIGGFDQEIEYNFDEVEVCLRLIDAGWLLVPLPDAVVHHKYLASHLRSSSRTSLDPYLPIKNRYYFALANGVDHMSEAKILADLDAYRVEVEAAGEQDYMQGRLTARELSRYLDRLDEGVVVGLERGRAAERQSVDVQPPPEKFRQFPRLCPPGGRLRICLLAHEYPPAEFGGVGRYMSELAGAYARLGHHVHVLSDSDDHSRVDYEDGVWVHRSETLARAASALEDVPIASNLRLVTNRWHELNRLHQRSPVDIVEAPLWLAEGIVCSLDPRFSTVTTLITSLQTIRKMHPSWAGDEQVEQMLALERETVSHAKHLHAISEAILETAEADFDLSGAETFVLPLGQSDRAKDAVIPAHTDARVEVLFVGRLERRKGADVLLEAIPGLLEEFPEVVFTIVGKDTPNTESEQSYRETFLADFVDHPDVRSRVRFLGSVSDEQLFRLYARCDIFCAPSRYESFGLVFLEAMMFGKPVVGCSAGGMRETIEEGGNGLLAEPGDVATLAAALRRLIDDPELRHRFGARSRERFDGQYLIGRLAEQTVETYRRIGPGPAATLDPSSAQREVVEQFTDILARTTGKARREAQSVAAALLDPDGYPMDYRALVESLLGSDPQTFVVGLYRSVLGREPDAVGLAANLGRIQSTGNRVAVVSAIASSAEARSIGVPQDWIKEMQPPTIGQAAIGLAETAALDDGEFIAAAYRILFRREADPAGIAGMQEVLSNGGGRFGALRRLIQSEEGVARGLTFELLRELGPQWLRPVSGLDPYWASSEPEFINVAFEQILGRRPDAVGLAGAHEFLHNGHSRTDLVRTVAESDEGVALGVSIEGLDDAPGFEPLQRESAHPVMAPRLRLAGGRRLQTALGRVTNLKLKLHGHRALPSAVSQLNEDLRSIRADLGRLFEGSGRNHESLHQLQAELQQEIRRQSMRLARDLGQARSIADDLKVLHSELVDVPGLVKTIRDEQLIDRERVWALTEATRQGLVDIRQLASSARRRIDGVGVEVRATNRASTSVLPEPRIPDRMAYESRLHAVPHLIALNVGCGDHPRPDYLNVDRRELPDVEIVADACRLPFGPGEVDEIASWHLVNTFDENELTARVLPYWRDLLKDTGILRIVISDWEALTARQAAGDLSIDRFAELTFGTDAQPGERNMTAYGADRLAELVRAAGFAEVAVVSRARPHGDDSELEVVALRGDDRPDGTIVRPAPPAYKRPVDARGRRAVVSIGTGALQSCLGLAVPSFARFGELHGYDVVTEDGSSYAEGRPLSWAKVGLLRAVLKEYEAALWIDADAMIVDPSLDPLDCLGAQHFQGLALHHTPQNGEVVNCGVWLLRAGERSEEFLDAVWDRSEYTNHPWWEQAAVISLLGYDIPISRPNGPPLILDPPERQNHWLRGTQKLDLRWNSVPFNRAESPRIVHWSGMSIRDRIDGMSAAAEAIGLIVSSQR